MGRKYKHNSESSVTITHLMEPSHSNFGGKVHGGYILSLMDRVAYACAAKHSGHYCVTASVDKVDFLTPIEVGELVTMRAMINYVGRTSMVVGIRVEAENVRTGNVKHCNASYFTMIAVSDEPDTPKPEVPGLILKTFDDARRFLRSKQRKEQTVERRKSFTADEFVLTEHLAELGEISNFSSIRLDFDV